MTDELQEDFQALGVNPSATVEDYKDFYVAHPETTSHQYSKQFKAQAELWYDGNVTLAILAEMVWHLSAWAGGMQEHGKHVEELIAIAKKDMGGGEEWQGDCKDDK